MSGAPVVVVREGDLTIRTMVDSVDEYARMAAWRNQPHVREFWDPDDPPATAASVAEEYAPDVRGETATRPCVIEVGGVPVGFIQFYSWAEYPDDLAEVGITVQDGAWSLDIFIGERQWVGRGVGSRTVRLLADHLFDTEGATTVAFGVEAVNLRARRAYEKAGFTPTVEFLDTDTRDGKRVMSILMVKSSSGHHRMGMGAAPQGG